MKKEIIGKYIAILGLLLFWAPLLGLADSYLIMSSSFQEITLFGTNEPKIPREQMSSAALTTVIGFLLSIVALTLLAVSVVGLNYRTKWLFWALTVYSTLLLFMVPVGTLFGSIVLVLLVLSRKKFGLGDNVT